MKACVLFFVSNSAREEPLKYPQLGRWTLRMPVDSSVTLVHHLESKLNGRSAVSVLHITTACEVAIRRRRVPRGPILASPSPWSMEDVIYEQQYVLLEIFTEVLGHG